MDTRHAVRTYIAENCLFSANGFKLQDDASLLETGVIDSTMVLELVVFVETEFGIQVADRDIVPDNFDSVDRLVAYIETQKVAGA